MNNCNESTSGEKGLEVCFGGVGEGQTFDLLMGR
jgi:hypothetical protein